MGIEEGVVRVEVDSRGTCSMVSRVVVGIVSIRNSGVLGHKGWQWYGGVVRGVTGMGIRLLNFKSSIASGRP